MNRILFWLRPRVLSRSHRAPSLPTVPLVDRSSAIAWARLIADHPEALFLDTETTGLDTWAEIVDIAIVDRDGRVLLNTLVRPQQTIPPEVSAIHGITMEDVRTAPAWHDIASDVQRLVHGRPVVVYNAEFDQRMIHQCCARCGTPVPKANWQCAMRAFAAYRGIRSSRGDFRWHKLEAAAAHFGLPPGGHRALSDAQTCRRVVLAMAQCDEY